MRGRAKKMRVKHAHLHASVQTKQRLPHTVAARTASDQKSGVADAVDVEHGGFYWPVVVTVITHVQAAPVSLWSAERQQSRAAALVRCGCQHYLNKTSRGLSRVKRSAGRREGWLRRK
jgi:hypothetical protein